MNRAAEQLTRLLWLNAGMTEAPAEEPELAVFRFTLGIPGFDDSLTSRIIGASSLLLLLANSVLSNSLYSTSQVSLCALRITLFLFLTCIRYQGHLQARAELLGVFLAGCCIAVPTINARLQEAAPGRGRRQSGAEVEGSTQCFQLDGNLSDEQKQVIHSACGALLLLGRSMRALIDQGHGLHCRSLHGSHMLF